VIIIVSVVFGLALLSRMMTYTVRFTENAVLTTFGKADPASSIKREPGLYFKLPEPIQSVTKYDTRARFLQVLSETQQTADSRQLTVESFCTWKVTDPLKFFQRFSNAGDRASDHYKKAEESLWANLRSAMGEISKYRIDELFNPDPSASKLPELEGKVLAVLQSSTKGGASLDDYGIKVLTVGINRIELPEQTTQAVFGSMKEDRARLVKEIESRGDSEAQTITSTADSNARKILQFAEAYAADIRRQGDEEAQTYIAQMNEAPEFAVFLKNVDFIRLALSKRITWIVDTTMPGFELMAPGTLRKTEKGKVPGVQGLMGDVPTDLAQRVEPAAPAGGGH
jgi:membrane protease subunit HflC